MLPNKRNVPINNLLQQMLCGVCRVQAITPIDCTFQLTITLRRTVGVGVGCLYKPYPCSEQSNDSQQQPLGQRHPSVIINRHFEAWIRHSRTDTVIILSSRHYLVFLLQTTKKKSVLLDNSQSFSKSIQK